MDKMLSALLAASVLTLPSFAQNKPFSTRNGRTVTSGAGAAAAPAAPRAYAAVGPAAAASNPLSAQASSVAGMTAGPLLDGGRALMGRASSGTRRGAAGRAVQRGGRAFWAGRRVDGGGSGAGESGGGSGEGGEAPQETPGYFKYGAKILTEGQAPKYEAAVTREHAFQAGEIALHPHRANHVGRAPSLQQGPRDTPPPCTPGSVGCSGRTAGGNSITPNAAGADTSGAGSSTPAEFEASF